MANIIETLKSWVSIIPRISVWNILEIVIIAVMVYLILAWIKTTKSWVFLRALLTIFLFIIFCEVLQLDTLLWILSKIATVAAIALIVIFQPELRKVLEKLGNNEFFKNLFPDDTADRKEFTEKTVNEIVKASFEMGRAKTGALMVIENKDALDEIERTGITIDGKVSSQLLINIFEHNTPLHDGAVIIKGNIITAATCYLPLSDNMKISKALGTRHRAALGISEVNDSMTVVVSEETGRVSLARFGSLTVMENSEALKAELMKLVIVPSNEREIFKLKRHNK